MNDYDDNDFEVGVDGGRRQGTMEPSLEKSARSLRQTGDALHVVNDADEYDLNDGRPLVTLTAASAAVRRLQAAHARFQQLSQPQRQQQQQKQQQKQQQPTMMDRRTRVSDRQTRQFDVTDVAHRLSEDDPYSTGASLSLSQLQPSGVDIAGGYGGRGGGDDDKLFFLDRQGTMQTARHPPSQAGGPPTPALRRHDSTGAQRGRGVLRMSGRGARSQPHGDFHQRVTPATERTTKHLLLRCVRTLGLLSRVCVFFNRENLLAHCARTA